MNWFSLAGRSYQVIPQVTNAARNDLERIQDYQVATASGELVPLSTLVSVCRSASPGPWHFCFSASPA